MNIEEMSLEELSQRVFVSLSSWGIEGTNAFNELLRRFTDLQVKVQELEKENKDLDILIKEINQQIADLQQQLENSKCCGNCINYFCKEEVYFCSVYKNSIPHPRPNHYCPNWRSDALTQEQKGKQYGKVE
jgi:cell division protein FtsB